MWGSNVPVTRTPDAHWMAEARYKGQKVVVVSPDYADNTKFADTWLPAQPGTDGAMAMAMGHVMLKEFFVERRVPFFVDYVQRYTDLPFLVTLEEQDGAHVPGKFLTAADLGDDTEGAAWKTVLVDGRTGDPVVPNGSLGFRYTESGAGRWNLDLDGVAPQLTLLGDDAVRGAAAALRRAGRLGRRAAPRGAGAPRGREAGHHGLRSDARPVRRAPGRAARRRGPPATTTRTSPTRPRGRSRSRRCPPRRWCGWPGRWPPTPRSRRAAP